MRNKPKPEFTLEEVIEELEKFTAETEEGLFTVTDLSERLNYPVRSSSIGLWVRTWVREGVVEFAGRVYRMSIDGIERPVPAYRWIGDRKESLEEEEE